MAHITFDYSKAKPHFVSYEVEFLKKSVEAIHEQMHSEQSIHRNSLVSNKPHSISKRRVIFCSSSALAVPT